MRAVADRPYVANYPPLKDWLRKHDARCQGTLPVGDKEDPSAYVESYMIRGTFCVVTVWADGLGWDIYTPGKSLDLDETFADAEKRLGVAS